MAMSDGASESGDAYFTEAIDAGVGVDADDEVEAPGVVSDGEGSDLCDFHVMRVPASATGA